MIDCVVKSYLCHETDPHIWGEIQLAGLALLSRHELQRYRDLIPGVEDRQDKWDVALDGPGKYVTVLFVQCNNEEQRAALNEENLAQ